MKLVKRLVTALLCLGVLAVAGLLVVNGYMCASVSDRILSSEDAASLDADCILVLGCKVHNNETPSDMLSDRLRRGIELYDAGASDRLLMSGDHGRAEYNEVAVMKEVAIRADVPSEHIFMDHAGFSTYESMYRAKEVFGAEKVVIVTQKYHLYRAVYAARALGLDAYGVAADYHTYVGQSVREVRELLARGKDFLTSVFKPEPTYLGDTIPISGNGDVTNDV